MNKSCSIHLQTANPILDKLDPYQFFIQYRLFRDATRSVNGTPVKDLTYLNRDLSKVILLDTHPEHASAQPENAIIVPKWEGDAKDRGLVAMIPFLECQCSILVFIFQHLLILSVLSNRYLQTTRCPSYH